MTEVFPHEVFRHCKTENFRRKIVAPPIIHKVFRYPNFFETLKGSPRNFLALRDKKHRQNRDTPFVQKFFDTRTFLKHRGPS